MRCRDVLGCIVINKYKVIAHTFFAQWENILLFMR